MRLNHIDLPITDMVANRRFFETHFGFRPVGDRSGADIAVLGGEDGFVLVLSRLPAGAASAYPDGFHIGFLLDSREAVDRQHRRMAAAGVPIVAPPSAMQGGWVFLCRAPDGILVEVAWRP